MKIALPALLASLLFSEAALAATPVPTVKQIGASFIEAPPGREKNLVPIGAFGAQEKVETYAVIMFKDHLIADIPAFGDDSKITATAILANKTQVPMGTVSASNFRKVSDDGHKTLVTLSIARLPDGVTTGVAFNGIIKLPVATSINRKSVAFQAKAGAQLDIGLGHIVVSNMDSTSITLSGDEQLTAVTGLKITKADGSTITAERGSFSRMGGLKGVEITSQWRFSGPIAAGKIEVASYRDLTTIDVPISLVVARPY